MPTKHVVKQGESVIQISEIYGLFAKTIWDDPANAALKEKRPDMNTLLPGDVVVVPEKRLKEAKVATGQRHRFRRKGIPALFRLQLFRADDSPRVGEDYTFEVEGQRIEGTTDDEGTLEVHLPAGAKTGKLIVGPEPLVVDLQFGHLDPASELTGVQKRLNNLGYRCGAPDGTLNAATKAALTAFQRRFGLDETGTPDDATVEKLTEVHDAKGKLEDSKTPAA